MNDFRTFDINVLRKNPETLYDLGNGAIRRLAAYFNYRLPAVPTVGHMFELVGKVDANKELQLNVGRASEILGEEATAIATKLLEESGILNPLNRSFVDPTVISSPECNLVMTGDVANWMLRRLAVATRINPSHNGMVYMAMSTRPMNDEEHQRVANLADYLDCQPTEYDFAEYYLVPSLRFDGFTVSLQQVDTTNGDDVLRGLFATYPDLLDTKLLVIGNAPSAIQSAGQLRAVARTLNPNFDADGTQLYVRSDKFSVATDDDTPDDAQNPVSGLGHLARSAAFIMKAID